MASLSKNEHAVLAAVRDHELHDGRDPIDSPVWSDGLAFFAGVPPAACGGIVSSLQRKCLVSTGGSGNEAVIWITASGSVALVEVGLDDKRINDLRAESGGAGDDSMVACCQVALGYVDASAADVCKARRCIAQVIADASRQEFG